MELKTEDKLVLALIDEFNGVHEKAEKLGALVTGQKPEKISEGEWIILHDQYDAMVDYRNCILERIAIHTIKDKPGMTDEEKARITAVSLGALEEA